MLSYAQQIRKVLKGSVWQRMLSRNFQASLPKSKYEIEPEYLKYLKPSVPVYERVNLQIKSYDFTLLEHFAKYAHKTALHMDIKVENAWATPHQALKVTNIEQNSKKVITDYQLNLYERNIQITNLHAYSAPVFFEVLQSSLPEGVTICVQHHQPEHETIRYIPDFDLIDLKTKLTELVEEYDLKLK